VLCICAATPNLCTSLQSTEFRVLGILLLTSDLVISKAVSRAESKGSASNELAMSSACCDSAIYSILRVELKSAAAAILFRLFGCS